MNKLQEIINHKYTEVDQLKIRRPDLVNKASNFLKSDTKFHGNFYKKIYENKITSPTSNSIICEIKRGSPSAGKIDEIKDPSSLAKSYINRGADVISILTDDKYFYGSISDFQKIRKDYPNIPLLRKDFIIDFVQIIESVEIGADCVLLMVSVLGERIVDFANFCYSVGIDFICEVHDENELEIALKNDFDIIGINNRDLKTFHVDLNTTKRLIKQIPDSKIVIGESGVKTQQDAFELNLAGVDALLVGETCVRLDENCNFDIFKNSVNRHPFIKICGLTERMTSLDSRVNFIGLMRVDSSKRFIPTLEDLDVLIDFYRENRFIPVIVVETIDECRDMIQRFADKCLYIQIHSKSIESNLVIYKELANYRKCHNLSFGIIIYQKLNMTLCSLNKGDIYLFDGPEPGSGKFDIGTFPSIHIGLSRIGIAGGISTKNVKSVCTSFVWMVDVSSSVESLPGTKNPEMIRNFVDTVTSL